MLMIVPHGEEIGPAGGRNRRKATVRIRQNPLVNILSGLVRLVQIDPVRLSHVE